MHKILIIEDEPEILELLKGRLESENYQVMTASNGEDGFLKFLKEQPDLVILDLMLPGINGYEVCRKIRIGEQSKTPVLMLTAISQDADRIVGRLRGANQYMTKPFKAHEVLAQVKLLLNNSEKKEGGRTIKKILVVDDDPDIVELLKVRLEENGYGVMTASNGIEAFAKAREEKPDLIVLDAAMPVMDGYTFAREIKWHSEIKDVPILVLTAHFYMREIFDDIGIERFLTKPLEADELLDKVRLFFKK